MVHDKPETLRPELRRNFFRHSVTFRISKKRGNNQNFHATGRFDGGLYEHKYPVLTRAARWLPSEGMASPILVIDLLIRLVTAQRARSACESILRSRPPRPTAEASCRAM